MKTIKLLVALLSLAVATMSFANPDEWYRCETKDYKVLFPQKPTASTKTINSELGELVMNLNIYESVDIDAEDNVVYMLNVTDYPDSVVNSDKPEMLEKFFRNTIDGAVRSVHGKLLTESKVELNKFPGREFRVDFHDGDAVIKMRVFLVHNRCFMLQTITKTEKDFNKSINKFMDSFTLVD